MALRPAGRKLSFHILSETSSFDDADEALLRRSNSDPIRNHDHRHDQSDEKQKLHRKKRRKRKKATMAAAIKSPIPEDTIAENGLEFGSVTDGSRIADAFSSSYNCSNGVELNCEGFGVAKVVWQENGGSVSTVTTVVAESPGFQNVFNCGELRQRSVNGGGGGGDGVVEDVASRVCGEEKVESGVEVNSAGKQRNEPNGNVVTKLETAESLDWKRLMAEDPNYMFSSEKSPLKYFMDDMLSGNSLRNTTTAGNEKERERVYDTIFRLPWRCELLINVGFFVCFDSFLSLLTIMPARILITFWRLLKTRQFKRPSAAELSDFGCFLIMVCGVTLLERADISLIYHMIRGQGTFKLYVVYNVLEIFDKLCQSFNGDVLQTLFNSAEGLANSSSENMSFWIWRYVCDETLAVAASNILSQAITLSTCIVAHNNALMALLVSNNFAEIKSNVFKRFSKDNIHSMVYYAQNILEAEGPWFESFLFNALLVYLCEMAVDIIKHSFIAKFNGIKPTAYSEFLEDLCKQTLNIQSDDSKNILSFVPLAPACVSQGADRHGIKAARDVVCQQVPEKKTSSPF
ncbi:hypothetical protein L484_001155 [Morus notabilis]|uniref:Protein POLLEN DEFECTIVE IN GUIDANCE 1 n=1 Tax=Morus notabilis TaxID=981085 RepID=W9QI48_9ROSA|nr:hypothetical protein L484_001155 [Morus notabilis]